MKLEKVDKSEIYQIFLPASRKLRSNDKTVYIYIYYMYEEKLLKITSLATYFKLVKISEKCLNSLI